MYHAEEPKELHGDISVSGGRKNKVWIFRNQSKIILNIIYGSALVGLFKGDTEMEVEDKQRHNGSDLDNTQLLSGTAVPSCRDCQQW